MKQLLHVLHIEDSKEDSELIHRLLAQNGIACEMTRVETRDQVFDELQNQTFDLILADCRLPRFSGLHALEIAHALKPEIPFVFVSGTIGEETAIESLRNGATDYVLKDRLTRLAPAIRRALSEAEERTLCRQLQQRLREAGRLEAISTLANGIAHDFNNILTIILGHSSLLSEKRGDPEALLGIARTISEAGERGAEVVQQLLAFARKSEGHCVLADLNRYLSAHLDFMKQKLSADVELTFEPEPDLPQVRFDSAQLDRILLNLVTNANDSMSGGGRIALTTTLVSADSLPELLPKLAGDYYVCLKVVDTGKGMDETTRERVFEPFYTTKERGRGTGLGLPVVYGLMQAHSGYIDIRSEPGEGTSVFLYFPVPLPELTSTRRVTQGADPSLCGSEMILVVDDETDVCFFLETILHRHGYQVRTAHNRDEAVKIFLEEPGQIDLVFSDIGLPRIDGITLCTELKKLKPDVRIILASGYSAKEFKERLGHLHSEAFLSKPYHTHEILQSVRKALDGVPAGS